MAFNPFRAFRKHQKVIMATLVGVSMVTFVLCGGIFGKGDFAGWFQDTFLGGRGRDNKVASVYGKTIEYPDIDRLRSQRRLANEYMSQATGLVTQKIVTKARDIAAKGDERLRGTVESVLRS